MHFKSYFTYSYQNASQMSNNEQKTVTATSPKTARHTSLPKKHTLLT